MRNDDELTLNASIEWFCESSFAADAVQVESLDFASLMGDVVPHDGLQRPTLTSGSPVRARASRRDDSRPTHVTHVHQTIMQAPNSAPIAVAVEATAAEGISGLHVSHLERALHVPHGSIHAPASKWRHRSKVMVAAGMPAHEHDGSMQCGSMLPPPLLHVPPPSTAGPEPALMIEHVPHVSVVPLTPIPAHSSQHARDVIARITAQAIAPPPTILHQCCPQAQSERATPLGHAGEAVARMTAEATALARVERG